MPPAFVVILTQEAEDSALLAAELCSRGVEVVRYPCLETRYLEFDPASPVAGRALAQYPWVAFTSKRGAIGAVPAREVFARSQPRVACVGAATAREVTLRLGLVCSVAPELEQTGAGLAQAIITGGGAPGPLLHIRGSHSSGELCQALAAAGWELGELVVYENCAPELQPLGLAGPAIAVFASPSAANRFNAANPGLISQVASVVIGGTTQRCVMQLGAQRVIEAEQPSQSGLLAAVLKVMQQDTEYGS